MDARSPEVREIAASPAQLRSLATGSPRRFPLLLESAATGPHGRYTVLAACPQASLRLRGDGRLECQGVTLRSTGFLDALDEWWQAERAGEAGPATATAMAMADTARGGEPGARSDAPSLPFRGGWMLFLAYELAVRIEPGLDLPALPADATCAFALRVPAALVYDHVRERCYLVHEAGAAQAGEEIRRALAAAPAAPVPAVPGAGIRVHEDDPARFAAAVASAQRHIAQGDVYQANLSRGWRITLAEAVDPAAIYERLRQGNPAPFAAYATLPDYTLLSSSPERLLCVRAGRIETRPIAGTRARHGGAETDRAEQRELLANPKERAEHVMLIDLERNDLGRICEAGSVEVNEFMVTESYPHLHHIVSNVRGRLRAGTTPGATLRAVFPGGTITGCPKYRCMQLIGELEAEPRGAYTGSLGFLNVDGDLDLNILIRSATLHGRELRFRTGAGIVADSDWRHELAETRAKAQGLLRAFGAAGPAVP